MAMDPPDIKDYLPLNDDNLDSFINDLATCWVGEPKALSVVLWKDLKGKKPTQENLVAHFQSSYDQDMSAFKSKGIADPLVKAWMLARIEEFRYNQAQLTQANPGIWPSFKPAKPGARETEEVPAALKMKGSIKIAAGLADFLTAVNGSFGAFTASNYTGHTTGSSVNQGMSVDIYLPGKPGADGFWDPAQAVKFLKTVDDTAGSEDWKGTRWIALYNDFDVAKEIKAKAKLGAVRFRGDGANYHGPSPAKLHIHLEVVTPADKDGP